MLTSDGSSLDVEPNELLVIARLTLVTSSGSYNVDTSMLSLAASSSAIIIDPELLFFKSVPNICINFLPPGPVTVFAMLFLLRRQERIIHFLKTHLEKFDLS